jgi:hypothetical protein
LSLFRQTTTSFTDAKAFVAGQASKQSTPEMLTKAGVAIQQAIQDWNRYNWQWLVREPGDADRAPYTIAAGQALYNLPPDFKDVYDIVLKTGSTYRALRQDTKRSFDRSVPWPLNSFTVAYNLINVGQRGKIQLQHPSDTAGTMTLLYHRVMTQPCAATTAICTAANDGAAEIWLDAVTDTALGRNLVCAVMSASATALSRMKAGNFMTIAGGVGSAAFTVTGHMGQCFQNFDGTVTVTFAERVNYTLPYITYQPATLSVGGDYFPLDVPEDHEAAILSKATEIFLSSVGASDQRLSYWSNMAERGIDKAISSQADKSDLDLAFEPSVFNSFNPNRVPE